MITPSKVILGLVLLAVTTGCFAAGKKELSIHGSYGTVSYAGTVTRSIEGGHYVFLVNELALTFNPDARVNSVDAIVNPRLRLITSYMPPGATRSTVTSEMFMPLHLTLDKDHLTARVRNVRFVVKVKEVDASTWTVLGLTDGHFLWPFASQLKP